MLVHSAPAASLAALWFWPCRLYLRDPVGEKVTRCDCISPLLTASVNPMMPYLIVLALNHSFSVRRRLYSAICALRVSVVLCLPNVHLPSQVGRRQYEGAPCLNFQLNWKHSQCGRTNHSPEIAFFVLVLAEYLMTLAIAFKLWSVNRYAVQAAFVTNIWKSPHPRSVDSLWTFFLMLHVHPWAASGRLLGGVWVESHLFRDSKGANKGL